MRDFGKVAPQFWTGKTGKGLRGCMEAQVVALYLMTSPHATMTGVYSLPMLYLVHETGLSEEGASKGLARCIEAGFCVYDAEAETVFVVNMAAHQIGDVLKPGDKRGNPIRSQYRAIHSPSIKAAFFARYGSAFGLESPQSGSPFEGASEGAFMPLSPSPSPSLEGGVGETKPKRKETKAPEVTFSQWREALPQGEAMLRADDPIFGWAEAAGISADFVDLAAGAFRDRYADSPKRYADWRATFRNAVKGNWLKIWRSTPDGFVLTTEGEQWRRVRESRLAASA